MTEPGDIVEYEGEQRVVVDVADYSHETGDPSDVFCVLRHLGGDLRRGFDEDGGDMHFVAAKADGLKVVGHL